MAEFLRLIGVLLTAYLVLGMGLVLGTLYWYHGQEKRRQGRC